MVTFFKITYRRRTLLWRKQRLRAGNERYDNVLQNYVRTENVKIMLS